MMHHVGNKMKTWRALLTAVAVAALLAACGDPATVGGPEGRVNAVTVTGPNRVEVNGAVDLSVDVDADEGISEAVDWESLNPERATVDQNGRVRGVAEGTATIRATSQVNDAVRDDHEVTVVAEGTGGDPGDGDGGATPGDPVPDPVVSDTLVGAANSADTFTLVDLEAGLYDVYALPSGDAATGDGTVLATAVSDGDNVSLPTSAEPWIRITPAGDASTTVVEGIVSGFVYSSLDNEVYRASDVDHFEPYIPGTLRWVLGLTDPGDVVAIADDIDVIELQGVQLTGGVDAHLILDQDVTIHGNGAVLRGVTSYEPGDPGEEFTYNSRMIYVAEGADVTLDGLTITGGTFIYHGAGIMNAGVLTVQNSTITGNRAWHTGGGITTIGGSTLTLLNSVVSDNEAFVEADEIGVDFPIRGGEGSTNEIGDGGWGGGLYARDGAVVTIVDTTFSNNNAKVGGGGIYIAPGADATIDGSDVDGNTAGSASFFNLGGGIYAGGVVAYANGTISNGTSGDLGGGMYVAETSDVALENATFANNTAVYGGGIYHAVNAAGDNLTPADPVASGSVTFTGNDSTQPDVDDDYVSDAGSDGGALRALRSDPVVAPNEGSAKRY